MKIQSEQGSFRDRDGFIFYRDNKVYRAIKSSYAQTWERLQSSGLYERLANESKVVKLKPCQVSLFFKAEAGVSHVLEAEKIPFISYPAEWTFGQLKKAALLTLEIQINALQAGFSLKDASSYNVQFSGPDAIFIDSLSFEVYQEGKPWVAYGQFCRHFLGPLLLYYYGHRSLRGLFVSNIDGFPLAMVSALLPFRSKFNTLAYTHIHLHARLENKHAGDAGVKLSLLKLSLKRNLALLQHLYDGIKGLKLKKLDTNWTNYYDSCSYSKTGYEAKKQFIERHLSEIKPALCADLGANSGEFSEIAARHSNYVVSCDMDSEVVRAIQLRKIKNLLALCCDLENPLPAFGWNNSERSSFLERVSKCDLTLALALVHHLCISNNVPPGQLAAFFAGISRYLIIEFVPKDDVQVKKLLVTRKDIFDDYTLSEFRNRFETYFDLLEHYKIPDSGRVLFLYKNKKLV